MSSPGIVIVGAGKAAAHAIVALREKGWKDAITLIGEEAHPPYDRPPLSKSAITGANEPKPVYILDQSLLASLGVTFLAGEPAVAIDRDDRTVELSNGRTIPYRNLLLATGARPRTLNGAEHWRTLRGLEDSIALRADFKPGTRVLIVGGGFIGLELAASAAKRGCAVAVVEEQPRILKRGVCDSIAAVVAGRHAEAGVDIVTGAKIDRIERGGVTLAGGRRIVADLVIAGIGAVPETSLAQASGLAVDNGIACDETLRTSDPFIHAAGDCCSFPHALYGDRRIRLEAWRAAQSQGAVAAENMLGGERRYEDVPWFWSDQYELTLQIAGLPADGTQPVVRQLNEGAFVEFQLDGDGRLVCASGIGRGNAIARDVRLAEMLIARRSRPDPARLADPATGLKSML